MKADLGVSIQELSADKIVAIGECTGSDPTSSEAKLLRGRLEDVTDLGGKLLPDAGDLAQVQIISAALSFLSLS